MNSIFGESFGAFLAVLMLFVVGIVILLMMFLRFVYKRKQPVIWPAGRRTFCWFPKFQLLADLPINTSETIEEQITNRLAAHGFHPVPNQDSSVQFARGSVVSVFSIKSVELNIYVVEPVSNPVALEIEYAALFGVVVDTGDLWTLCREIKETLEREVV